MLIIEVNKGNLEMALKQYKGKVIRTKQQDFTKPSVKNRLKLQKAKYLEAKKNSE